MYVFITYAVIVYQRLYRNRMYECANKSQNITMLDLFCPDGHPAPRPLTGKPEFGLVVGMSETLVDMGT